MQMQELCALEETGRVAEGLASLTKGMTSPISVTSQKQILLLSWPPQSTQNWVEIKQTLTPETGPA